MPNSLRASNVIYLKRDVEAAAASPVHHPPKGFSDRFAMGFTKLLRLCADTFFAKRYGHRAIVLETVAAVPGMVGATIRRRQVRCWMVAPTMPGTAATVSRTMARWP